MSPERTDRETVERVQEPLRPPDFATEEEEAAWLESDQGLEYLAAADWKPARFRPADPTLVPVTIRLPEGLRDRIRELATGRGMGYQTLARQWLLERCDEEEAKEAPAELQGFISELDPVDRRVVLLRVRGWTVERIAGHLEPPLPTAEVSERLQSLDARLQEYMESASERGREVLELLREAS